MADAAHTLLGVFERLRRVALEDGRRLIVQYEGERYGWGAYISGPGPQLVSWDTPAAAISAYLGYSDRDVPGWVTQLSDDFERELRDAPRYACPCCGYKTLLNPRSWEICGVCRWEDDPLPRSDDEHSGPNHVSLRQARENFRCLRGRYQVQGATHQTAHTRRVARA